MNRLNRPLRYFAIGVVLCPLILLTYWADKFLTGPQLMMGFFLVFVGSVLFKIRRDSDLAVYFAIGAALGCAIGRLSVYL